GDALDDKFVGHLELDGDIQRLVETIEQGFERRALGEVARISIEDETLARIRLGNALFQHAEYDLVGYQTARIHHRLRLHAQRGTGLDRSAQQVAGGYVWNCQFLLQRGRLSTFARTGSAE